MRIKSKKAIGIFLAVTTLVTGLFSQTPVRAESEFEIVKINGKKYLIKYNGRSTNVKVPEGVEVIESSAFDNNMEIECVKLPESLKRIEMFAFDNCWNLKEVFLPKGLEEIGTGVFIGCKSIKSIHLNKKLKHISLGAFNSPNSNLQKITVAKGNKYFKSKKGVLYSKNMEKLYCYPAARKSDKEFTIPKTVKKVASYSFSYNNYLEKVIVNKKINFGSFTFSYCKSLQKVIFKKPYGKAPDFHSCEKLETVILAKGQKTIRWFQFDGCKALTNINLPSSLEVISYAAFRDCENLTNLDFPKGLKKIKKWAFKGCTKLEKPILPDTVEVHEKAFDNVEATVEEQEEGEFTYEN